MLERVPPTFSNTRRHRAWGHLALVLSLAGCTRPNPAFMLDGEGADSVGDEDVADGESTASGATTEDDATTAEDGDTTDEDTTDEGTTDGGCVPPETECSGDCVDTASDPDHCGLCGKTCDADQTCVDEDCVPFERVVFVTSALYTINLQGWEGAIDVCQSHASIGQLEGEFLPWLGTEANSPDFDFVGDGPWVRTDGVLVAESFADLVDGSLEAPINLDELGEPGPTILGCGGEAVGVWTGVFTDGTPTEEDNCNNWSPGMPNSLGLIGDLGATDGAWTDACIESCAFAYPIYCFQQ